MQMAWSIGGTRGGCSIAMLLGGLTAMENTAPDTVQSFMLHSPSSLESAEALTATHFYLLATSWGAFGISEQLLAPPCSRQSSSL